MRNNTLLAIALLLGFACSRIESHEPEIVKVEGELQQIPSSVNLPLMMSMQDLETLVNEKLQGELYADRSFEGDNMALVISKKAPIQLRLEGNKLFYDLPLQIAFEGTFEKKIIVKIKKTQKLDFAATLKFCSTLDVNQDWQAVINTSLLGINWIEKPTINIIGLKVTLAKLAESQLEKRMPEMLGNLDRSVREKLKLRDIAQKVWSKMQQPMLVHKQYNKVWLKALPKKFYMSHIDGHNGNLVINTRLDMELFTTMGETPPASSPADTLLPQLLTLTDTTARFDLNVLTKLPLHALNQSLNEHVPKKKIEFSNYAVNLKEFEMMGSDSQMVLRVDLGGDVRGRVYFKGKPAYDSVQQVLSLQGFDFDVRSEEVLLSSADWLMHDTFKEKVQEELNLPLAERLHALPALIQGALSHSKMAGKIQVDLKDLRIVPRQLLITYKDIQMITHAEGRLLVTLVGLPQ
jgi:hypothetical protein